MPHRARPFSPHRRPRAFGLAVAVAALVPVACSSDDGTAAGGTDRLTVVAGFYPLQYVAEQVGGDLVDVVNLTAPGTEPHDLELSPRDVAVVQDADLIVHLSGFQPAVDAAVDQSGAPTVDAADHVGLIAYEAADLDGDHAHDDEEEGHDDGDGHAEEDDDDHDHEPEDGALDLHFWLDPTRLATLAEVLADALGAADPANAERYDANATALTADLGALDAEVAAGLASCEDRHLVTSHTAFGYLAQRYDLEQVGIAGLSPSEEPSAGALADLADFVSDHGVATIYFETLVDPGVAETLAAETGAATAVLDPIEGITDRSAGPDYPAVMRANLAAIRTGQPCP